MMSGDELMVTIGSGLAAAWLWWWTYVHPLMANHLHRRRDVTAAAWLGPLLAVGVLIVVLRFYADAVVRQMLVYQVQYALMGAAWVILAMKLLSVMGLRVRDDMLARQNPAAALACAGAIVGIALSFAGANVGDGPGWWVVVFCALWSTGTLLASWLVLELTSGVAERITVERDLSTGLRMATFFVAGGMIVGRAVAGDWESFDETITDFYLYASPGAVLLLAAWGVEVAIHMQPYKTRHLSILTGALPAAGYLAGGTAYVISRGWWT